MINMDNQKEHQKNDYEKVSRIIHNGKVFGGIAAGAAAAVTLVVKTVPKVVKKLKK